MSFTFDPAAVADARREEVETYSPPELDGLSDVVVAYPENTLRVIADHDLKRIYTDALIDLHRLVHEYRFEAALALTMLRDYVIKRDRGQAPVVTLGPNTVLDTLPMPAETVVVLRRYAIQPPSADELFANPHQQIAGGRMLSRWFAAQMIDSAVYRGIAACDRLAILLRCQAGLPIESRGERRLQPTFTRDSLRKLNSAYRELPDWEPLKVIARSPFFEFIRQERNGFTHERRRPSELHGDTAVVYGSQDDGAQETVPPMDASTHYATAPAFYNEILLPAVRLTRSVIRASAAAPANRP